MTREEIDENGDDMMIVDTNPKMDNDLNDHYLRNYYEKLFPYTDIYKWLSYGHDGNHPGCDGFYFGRREFSFTNKVWRYKSFENASALERSIKSICPDKIDIGAVYNPNKKKDAKLFTPVERELVFDIDITDYDDVRYCCSGADVCSKCWPLMTVAIKVMDTSLREDFGFKHILWVFSGRRGVHCWVCDAKARRLTNEQRSAVAEYFQVDKVVFGNKNNAKKVDLMGHCLHPFLARSYLEFLKNFFEGEFQETQSIFSSKEKYEKVLAMITDEDIQSELRGRWENIARSVEAPSLLRWEQLKKTLQSKKRKAPSLKTCVEEIVFTFTYPRIDLAVSKQMNHLLKAPFCVHPGTGRVCVPIDPDTCHEFDPLTVPTLSQLVEEINSGGMDIDMDDDSAISLLRKSIKFFRSSFLGPLLKSCKEEIESSYKTKMEKSKDTF